MGINADKFAKLVAINNDTTNDKIIWRIRWINEMTLNPRSAVPTVIQAVIGSQQVPKKDENGNIIYKPIVRAKVDADGNIIFKTVNQPKKDENGNIVYKTVTQPKKDENGNIVYKTVTQPKKDENVIS